MKKMDGKKVGAMREACVVCGVRVLVGRVGAGCGRAGCGCVVWGGRGLGVRWERVVGVWCAVFGRRAVVLFGRGRGWWRRVA